MAPAQVAEALRPIAGVLLSFFLLWGLLAPVCLAVPVLAGSAAYAVAELLGWPSTLEARFPEAIGFQMIILAATIIGFAIVSLPIIRFSCLSGPLSSTE